MPISFRITSSSVWNTFYVPALAGMIYAMPGMETQLHAVMNQEGDFTGLSGMYSGSGFSRMNFGFRSLSRRASTSGSRRRRRAGTPLDREAYLKLEKPSEAEPVRYFGSVESGLFDAAVGLCVAPGQMCVREMHHIDRMGGGGEGQRGEPRSGSTTTTPPGERRRALRRHLPRLGPAAEESVQSREGHDAARSARRSGRAVPRRAMAPPGPRGRTRAGPTEQRPPNSHPH